MYHANYFINGFGLDYAIEGKNRFELLKIVRDLVKNYRPSGVEAIFVVWDCYNRDVFRGKIDSTGRVTYLVYNGKARG